MIRFPAKFIKEDNGQYSVMFLGSGMEGCITYGDSLDEAMSNAQEALDAWLGSLYSNRMRIPVPEQIKGNGIYSFSPSPRISFAIQLREEREKLNLSQQQMAEKTGIAAAQYQRLENPRKTNPTLSTLVKLQHAIGKDVFLRI